MTFLVREDKQDFLRQIKSLSKSSQKQTNNVIREFGGFCSKEYEGRTQAQVLGELKILKKKLPEEESNSSFIRYYSFFINDLSDRHELVYVRVAFSFFKNYLRWNGIIIYNEDTKTFLKFPKELKQTKHVIKKQEIKEICSMVSQKRRILYLVLSSSAMRIGETLQHSLVFFIKLEIPDCENYIF